jgi:hypothetical protein
VRDPLSLKVNGLREMVPALALSFPFDFGLFPRDSNRRRCLLTSKKMHERSRFTLSSAAYSGPRDLHAKHILPRSHMSLPNQSRL